MLGVLPVRRKTTKSVLGITAWNLLILAPFILAFWIITETNHGSNRSCFGIPWDVANFTRWALLAFAAYQLISLPLNLYTIKRSHKLGRESRLTHWMQMADVLHWLANWAIWFYCIAGLANRSQCHDRRMRDLLFAIVIISALFALAGLIVGLVVLAKFLKKMLTEISEESKLKSTDGVDVLVARGGLHQGVKQGGVEILEVRKSNVDDMNRVRPDANQVIRSEYVDKGDARVVNNGLVAETIKKEETIISRRDDVRDVREREITRDRTTDPRYMARDERLDVSDNLPTNTHNIRTNELHASQPRKF